MRGGAKVAFQGLTFCFPGNQVCFLQGKLSPGNLKLDSLLSESDRCGLWLKIYFVYFVYVLQQLLNYLWMCSGCVLGCMMLLDGCWDYDLAAKTVNVRVGSGQ